MILKQAFVSLNQMNKQALFDKLGDDEKTVTLVNQAFEDGRARWTEELTNLFGEGETKRLESMLQKPI